MAAKQLNTRQRAFVEAYLANGFNATQAAIEAGYAESSARVQGHRLITNANISELVEQRIKDMAMSADEALARLSMQARCDVTEFLGLSVGALKAHPSAHLLHKVKVTRRIIPPLDKDKPDEIEERIELEAYNAQTALLALIKERHLRAGEPTDHLFGVQFNYVPSRGGSDDHPSPH